MLGILLKNVRLEVQYNMKNNFVESTKTALFDIFIDQGRFLQIASKIEGEFEQVIDAKGQLLIPSFREMHTHLDKTYFGGEWKAPKPANEGIFTRLKEEATLLPNQLSVMEERANALIQHYIRMGHTHIRTHINVDPHIETKHIELIKTVLAQYSNQITYEIVAFPQHGILRNGREFITVLEKALQQGVTHIGGVDPALVDRNVSEGVKIIFDLAEKYDVRIDIHLHEQNTLGAYTIEKIIQEINDRNFTNEVTISHAFALAGLPPKQLDSLIEKLSAAKINITTTVPIGAAPITIPIKYLHENKVDISFGHDSLIDHWSPFGSGDTIRKLNLFIQRFHYIDEKEIGQSLKYATGGITPLDEFGLQQWPKVGDHANALLVDAVSSAHLIARRCPITTVISKGQVISREELPLKGEFR